MDGDIDQDVMDARLKELMQVQEGISYEINQAKVGQVIEVLVEEKEALTSRYRGRSYADAPDEVDGQVIFTCDHDIALQVKITEAKDYDLIGVWQESKA